MESERQHGINLRKEGKLQESNQLFSMLLRASPNDAFLNYQYAWSFDARGEESKAVPYYERAIDLGLSGKELEGAIVGLGSTFRALGEYEKSKGIFVKGLELFPDNRAIQVFYSMTLHNLNEHQKAMEIVLSCLTETTSDEEILNYRKAINFYKDKLNDIWK
ncbi:tetratricopeptide repeat protein [Jeotgalibacillus sp. S-D1]|uniref:tetratricopeptide repeat protein n=1 Tax=Jeotgalibacillus sp. S-D1 TaxID=2552189 RepID=UPI0010592803|nr:tetratricopeptide repeat protein [Jeotgalibacillus sp. S-D1]TDL33147.1 tetratricopeptide repeat protein [Jeotgalibacillus sp. S-D1]